MRRPLLLVPLLLAAGCGGGGSSSKTHAKGRASAVITFVWPKPSRLIPLATQSVKVELAGPTPVDPRTVTRDEAYANGGASRLVYERLETGDYTVTATAYDQNGKVLSKGSGPARVAQSPAENKFAVTLTNDILRGAITGPGVVNGAASLRVNKTATYVAHFYNKEGVEALVDPSTVFWTTISGVSDVSGASDGVMQRKVKAPGAVGNGHLVVRYQESDPTGGTPATTLAANLDLTITAPSYTPAGAIGRGAGAPGNGSATEDGFLDGLAGTYAANHSTVQALRHRLLSRFAFDSDSNAGDWDGGFEIELGGGDRNYPIAPVGPIAVTPRNELVYIDDAYNIVGLGATTNVRWRYPAPDGNLTALATDGDDNTYVLLSGNPASTLKVLSSSGSLVKTYSIPLTNLRSVAVAPSGKIYVSDATETYQLKDSGSPAYTVAGTGVVVDSEGMVCTIEGSGASWKVNVYIDQERARIARIDVGMDLGRDQDMYHRDPETYTLDYISVDRTTDTLFAGGTLHYAAYDDPDHDPSDLADRSSPAFQSFKIHRYKLDP